MDRTKILFSRAAWGTLLLALFFCRAVSDEGFGIGPGLMTVEDVEAIFRSRLQGPVRSKAPALAKHLIELTDKHGFDPAFVLSLIQKESTFQVRVVSRVGAVGLMQCLPSTAKYVSKRYGLRFRHADDLMNPFMNLTIGIHYLTYLRNKLENTDQILTAYNMGPTRVRVMIKHGRFDPGPVRGYVDAIKRGRTRIRREGRELATITAYARALTGSDKLWQRLQFGIPAANAAEPAGQGLQPASPRSGH